MATNIYQADLAAQLSKLRDTAAFQEWQQKQDEMLKMQSMALKNAEIDKSGAIKPRPSGLVAGISPRTTTINIPKITTATSGTWVSTSPTTFNWTSEYNMVYGVDIYDVNKTIREVDKTFNDLKRWVEGKVQNPPTRVKRLFRQMKKAAA